MERERVEWRRPHAGEAAQALEALWLIWYSCASTIGPDQRFSVRLLLLGLQFSTVLSIFGIFDLRGSPHEHSFILGYPVVDMIVPRTALTEHLYLEAMRWAEPDWSISLYSDRVSTRALKIPEYLLEKGWRIWMWALRKSC